MGFFFTKRHHTTFSTTSWNIAIYYPWFTTNLWTKQQHASIFSKKTTWFKQPVGPSTSTQFLVATQNAASTIISDYTGSLFASTKTFYAQNILTEHNFFAAIKYNILQNFSPSKKKIHPSKTFYKMNKYGILSKKRIFIVHWPIL